MENGEDRSAIFFFFIMLRFNPSHHTMLPSCLYFFFMYVPKALPS